MLRQQILEAIRGEQPQGVQILPAAEGKAGTDQTVAAMREFALAGAHNPAIVHLAREIVRGVGSHDYEGEVARVHAWVQEHVRYTQDPRGQEWVQTPSITAWVLGQGDCDDHAVLVAALGMALGHGAAFRVVATDPSRPTEASHVYALVGIRSRTRGPVWIACDTTQPEPVGWEPPPERILGRWDFELAAA